MKPDRIRLYHLYDDAQQAASVEPGLRAAGFEPVLVPFRPELLEDLAEFGKYALLILQLQEGSDLLEPFLRRAIPGLPYLPMIVLSDGLSEEDSVRLLRLGVVGVFKTSQLERLAEVARKSVWSHRTAESESTFSSTDYQMMFDQLPDPVFLEDFSQVKAALEEIKAQGVSDIRAYLAKHTAEIAILVNKIRVMYANKKALAYMDSERFFDSDQIAKKLSSPEIVAEFIEEFGNVADGKSDFSITGVNIRGGFHILTFKAMLGHEEDLRRVMVIFSDVTPLVVGEKRLREQERQIRSLVEQTPSIFYSEIAYGEGRLLYMSPQISRLTGYRPEDYDNGMAFWKKIIHPDDLHLILEVDEENTPPNLPQVLDYRVMTADGREIWVRDTFQLICDEDGKPAFWQGAIYDVTEEKLAQLELEQNKQQLDHLIANMPGMVYRTSLGERGKVEFLSDGCEILTGYPADSLVGKPRDEVRDLLQVGDDLEANIERYLRNGNSGFFEIEYTLRTRFGETKWVMDRGFATVDANGKLDSQEGIILDITGNKLAQAQLQEFSEELEQLYRNSSLVSGIMDSDQLARNVIEIIGKRPSWDAIAINLYDEQVGRMVLAAVQVTDELPNYIEGVRRMERENVGGASQWVLENKVVLRSGDVTHIPSYYAVHPEIRSALYVPLVATERSLGVFAIESRTANAFSENDEKLLTIFANQVSVTIANTQLLRTAHSEIRARMQVEEQLRAHQGQLEAAVDKRTAELRVANDELAKASSLKTEFLSSISHELRTPLTGILGLSEVLTIQSFGELNERQMGAIKLIAENGQRLLSMINDILDFTRIEAGQMTLALGRLSLNYTVKNLVTAANADAAARGLRLDLELVEPDVMLECDSKKLKQMVGNLISNAIKFTPSGGGILVKVRSLPEDAVQIMVRDSGIGISETDIARLFMPFVQLDGRLERTFNGAGLGLVLVNRLAQLHGGNIHVESKVGAGSAFTITLPVSQPKPATA